MFSFFHRKKDSQKPAAEEEKTELSTVNGGEVQKQAENEVVVTFESVPDFPDNQYMQLIEIRDKQLLTRIGNAIPGTMQAVLNSCGAGSAQVMAKSAGNLYRANIPQGAVLDKSRTMENAFRGTFHNGNGINGDVNFTQVDGSAAQNLAGINALNAVMGVASMVVGQYYMAEISSQLGGISNKIDSIANFQENEYKSKVLTLIAEVQKISNFQMEIMENDELRKRELMHLRGQETNCAQLLSQANLALDDFSKKTNLDYNNYVASINEAHGWYQYQQILLQVMHKIAELTHALNLGAVSQSYCYASLTPYVKQTEETLSRLRAWHANYCTKFEINVYSQNHKRQGIDAVLVAIPSVFNHGLQYVSLPDGPAEMIKKQIAALKKDNFDQMDKFKQDVQLIAKDGKLYYLPSA